MFEVGRMDDQDFSTEILVTQLLCKVHPFDVEFALPCKRNLEKFLFTGQTN